MADYACPQCGDPLSIHGSCGSCDYGHTTRRKSAGYDPELAQRSNTLVAETRQRSIASAPTSLDLTEQQWYNCCKFWPFVAAHCKRPRPIVGPDHPLDATAAMGPMLRGRAALVAPRRGDDPDALEERAAIQNEPA